MIASSVGWTPGGSPSDPDCAQPDILQLQPDEALVRVDPSDRSEDAAHGPLETCRGVRGRVIEAGAEALWFVDRAVFLPAEGSRCGNCEADRRDALAAFADQQASEAAGDERSCPLVVAPARELCLASVAVDWRKPTSISGPRR